MRCAALLVLVALVAVQAQELPPRGISHTLYKHTVEVSHDEYPLASNRKALGDPVDENLGGNVWPVAIYWFYLDVGTPSKPVPVAIDTGSITLDIEGKGCDGCVTTPPNNPYSAADSSTSSPVACTFGCSGCQNNVCTYRNVYQTCSLKDPEAPCSISGTIYRDQVSLAGLGPVQAQIEVIEKISSNFDQFKHVCGVMGVAGDQGEASVFATLVREGKIAHDSFSMCFHHGSKGNGTVTWGGTDPRLYSGEIQWQPNAGSGQGLYGLEVSSIDISGKPVEGSNQVFVLDSGTNVLLVPDSMYKSVASIFTTLCSTYKMHGICDVSSQESLLNGVCYNLTTEQIAAYPTIEVKLSAVTLTMEPDDYLLTGEVSGRSCFGIRNTGEGGLAIIGDTTMEDYYTVFDRANNRIGWAPVNTTNCGSI